MHFPIQLLYSVYSIHLRSREFLLDGLLVSSWVELVGALIQFINSALVAMFTYYRFGPVDEFIGWSDILITNNIFHFYALSTSVCVRYSCDGGSADLNHD